MTILLQALLFGTMTAIMAGCAHRGFSAFHDGVRPFIREVERGAVDRVEAGKQTWDMSLGFVLFYAVPHSLITGVMGKHILGLTADWLGVRLKNLGLVLVSGFAWGVAAALIIAGVQWLFANLPRPISEELLMVGLPLIYMLPLIPAVATASQFGTRMGLAVAALAAVVYLAVKPFPGWPAEVIAFVVASVALVYLATRECIEPPPPIEELVIGAQEVRRGKFPLLVNGALFSLGASLLWLAGDPASTMLVALGRPLEAACVALLSWIGFVPMVTFVSLTSRAYVNGGIPDGMTGLGFLIRVPALAAAAGLVAMAGEIWGIGRIERVLAKYPGLHGAGAGIRDGLLQTSETAFLIGGALSANALWPGFGIFLVGGFWLLNEAFGVPVMRVAVGPLAAILVGLLLNVAVVLNLV